MLHSDAEIQERSEWQSRRIAIVVQLGMWVDEEIGRASKRCKEHLWNRRAGEPRGTGPGGFGGDVVSLYSTVQRAGSSRRGTVVIVQE